MKSIAPRILLLTTLFLTACNNSENGHYVPVTASNIIYLVDTQTGKMYNLPPQHREGSDPTSPAPAKWKLVAEF